MALNCSVNYLDLGPQFASLTLGFSNTVATLPGMFTPTITGYIVQNKVTINSILLYILI